jgi:serine/threonine protein kinase
MLQLNSVKERLLFLSPVVQAGWEKEASISDFDILANLGQGAFGLVTKVQHKKSQVIYAIKQMEKKRLKNSGMIEQITTEIKIMYSLNHENIVKLFNHFEDDTNVYLIIDYAPGGQLWNKLQKSPGKRLPEKEVALYVKDLVASLEYLHGKGIIHRDIKPENLLIDGKGRLKLADFGWSNYFKSDAQRTTFCGTLDYLAPEMIEIGHQHDHMVDIWAVGVLTYELLTGKSPFSPSNPSLKLKDVERGTQQNIISVKFDFPKEFPPLAKDLVSKILRKNPKTRLNLFEIKTHPWVKCTAFVVKKKELDPKALIEEVTFGQNMAEKNNFAQFEKNLGFTPAFTQEEIISFARPDSMLDKAKFDFSSTSKTLNLDKQIEDFRKQMGLYGTTATATTNNNGILTTIPSTPTTPGSYLIDPSPTNGVYDSAFSKYSDDLSPTKIGKDFEYRLKIKTDECIMLQQEVDRLKKAAETPSTQSSYIVKAFEEENATLKSQLAELKRKLAEKDSALDQTRRSFEERITKEALQSDRTIKDLEAKLKGFGSENGKSVSSNMSQSKNEELEEVNGNLNAQISEYNKLIKRLYDDPAKDADADKKRMLEDIKTLRSLSSIKQDRIERLEAKVKSLGA